MYELLNQVAFRVGSTPVTWNFVGLLALILLAFVGTMWLKGKATPRTSPFPNEHPLTLKSGAKIEQDFQSMWAVKRPANIDAIPEETEL